MTTKQPFLPLFFGDFLASTAEWDGEEQSLFLLLLGHQWSLGSLPSDPDKLRRLVRWERETFGQFWQTVRSKFEERDGRLYNPRLEQHRQKSQQLSEKNSASGRKGAASKWGKDGERHDDAMANAMQDDGERHESAITECHPESDGVTDGNPSHPIPSHPIHVNPPVSPRKRGERKCPDAFEITPDLAAIRSELPADFDLDGETRKFRDHEFATARKDWPATWRNWMRTARDRKSYAKRAASAPTIRQPPTPEAISAAREAAARQNVAQLAKVMPRLA